MSVNHIDHISQLNKLIKGIHHFGAYNFDRQPKSYSIFADGLVGLVYQESDAAVLYNDMSPGKLFLYGQTVKPLQISYTTDFNIIVFFFQPFAIKYLFGIDAHELTDNCLDFDLIDKSLRPQVENCRMIEDRINTLVSYFEKASEEAEARQDKRIAYAAEKIIQHDGAVSLQSLRDEINITERTFERQFLQHVGVSPNTFTKICRFNFAVNQLKRGNYSSFTDIAYEAGYADQSHFIRQFKEFTSITPKQYVKLLQEQKTF